jgi:hypothetical protein
VIEALCDLDARVVCFPVRHHSPACARRVAELVRRMRPAAVLIEGPSDFNERLDELFLRHRLPIAIYSYVRLADDRRRGAYYPFCIYSPEWQALQTAREVGAIARFIDLPWSDVARVDETANRYADQGLRRGEYVRRLCRQTGVENFDDLWDRFFELEADLNLADFMRRCHHFCLHTRLLDVEVRLSDRRREAFMTQQIRVAMEEFRGRILVVTGGYHSSAIHARLTDATMAGADDPATYEPEALAEGAELGIALTPYSYERLDSLRGYDAGMPNPGFYHQVWQDAVEEKSASHRRLLARVVGVLRKRGQQISAADLIAAETTARGLAQLRGHASVWRQDLVDGIIGALIKEERAYGIGHPLLDAVHEVFRGGERGVLAEGTVLPPLVQDLRQLLARHELEPQMKQRDVDLDLHLDADRERSRLMHRLRILAIAGYERTGGADLVARTDLSRVWERWRIRWTPDFDATTIEAARYGPTLADAAAARLAERAGASERNADEAALLLLDASLAGLTDLADEFLQQLGDLIRSDNDFFTVTKSLGHLLYLYVHDHVLQTAGRADLATLVLESFTRGMWLLESLGQVAGRDKDLLSGIRTLLDAFERCAGTLNINRDEFVAVLQRVGSEKRQSPLVRGAASGALWTIGESDASRVFAQMILFSDPDCLGDFLAGLFCMAREVVQRHRELVLSIDKLLVAYADEEFLTALPSLRLAFTYFTPREKHHMGLTLLEALGLKEQKPLTTLEESPETMARALAFESRLFEAIQRYGLRGGSS